MKLRAGLSGFDEIEVCMIHWIYSNMILPPVSAGMEQNRFIDERSVSPMSERGKKIAIIGAGPAGYTAAQELSKNGYTVDIYDKESRLGGAVYTGIPAYRMSKAFLDKVFAAMQEDDNITFHFDTKIDREKFAALRKDYDKILIATGAQVENTFGFETGKGLYAGLTLLYDLNINGNHEAYKKYKKAMVWGGGNVAMDCARSLVRIIDDVTVVYRRSEEEITANKSEIRDARDENVKFDFLCNVKRVLRDAADHVSGAQLIRQELGEPDESGRRSPHSIPGTEFVLDADLIVMAIGQKVDLSELDETLEITGHNRTNMENIFIAGDANLGPATIGKALMEGRAAAAEMQKTR